MADGGDRKTGRARGRSGSVEREPLRRPGQPGTSGIPGEPPSAVHGARAAPRDPGGQPQEGASGRASLRPIAGPQSGETSARAAGTERSGIGRGAGRGRQERESQAIVTRPQYPGFQKQSFIGEPCDITANYFEVLKTPHWHLRQYRVDFAPDIDNMGVRKAMIRQHENTIGKYIFDGTLLYCATKLPQPLEVVSARRTDPDNPIRITLRLVGELEQGDQMYIVVMNIIFRRCLGMLNLTEIKRDYYDAEASIPIPQHKLTIWPGYLTSIRQHEEKLLLGVDLIFKVLRAETALDVFQYVRNRGGDFRAALKAELEGKVVMTAYNKRTYRIDDIDFDKNPRSTFHLRKEDRDVSYLDYYWTRYQQRISNDTQPLLLSRPTKKDRNRGDDQPVLLVPELCGMTGLTDEMRKNFNTMKDIGEFTRLKPDSRVTSLLRFNSRITGNPEIQRELNSWGLKFSEELVECKARRISPQNVVLGAGVKYGEGMGDWAFKMRNSKFAVSVNLDEWAVLFPQQMGREVEQFVGMLQQCAQGVNFRLAHPKMISMQADRSSDYTNRIREECSRMNYNMIMVVMRSQRADTYGAIKKLTCADIGIPSQVITGRILKGAPGKMMSIATKVMIQVASKMGAEPWRVELPENRFMVCGYDTYHDARQRKAVGAFVASFNQNFTRYVSSVQIHENNEEISPSFQAHMMKCLRYYRNVNGSLPSKIFIYRDGVGAGDIARVKSMEVDAVKQACASISQATQQSYNPGIAYIIVSKRINSRFFLKNTNENPKPGTLIDNTVTLSERYDFFLVSQTVTQGTVSPTSFNIIEDTTRVSTEIHQRLAYAITHLYYNWPGTLRVPAPCQYAHKLAYLIGESVNALPREQIEGLPYYL